MPVTQLSFLDYTVMAIYFAVVLGIGWALRRAMQTSSDFLVSGRSLPPWVTGLAFLSANLGAQEVIGMGASGAKYGYLGVELFFMISGFVILMTAANGSVRDFVISRAVRLYPAFWVCCTATFLVTMFIGEPRYSASLEQYIVNMTML
ncbi:MAG: hypothetical protein MUF00_19285, partial [Gemmatimonadaceae bacterium]|nr:hypothetical protein [Gemmatimonadaceae bacterium]